MVLKTLAGRLARSEITSLDLINQCLARIDTYDGQLQAFTQVFHDKARAEAQASDRRRASGLCLGPMDGLPFAVKDLFHIKGSSTHAGTHAYSQPIEGETAPSVARLESAGMIALGKTRMDEFAYGAWGVNALTGTPWNPWDMQVHRVAGGSSSGSAVAVSAGLAPVALGSDTGGSSRVPAAFCGCVGLRPSFDAIDTVGTVPLSPSLDAVGLFTLTVADAGLVFAALTDHTAQKVVESDQISGMCIGHLPPPLLDGIAPEVQVQYQDTVETLQRLGARVVEFAPPRPFSDYLTDTVQLVSAEIYRNFGHLAGQPELAMQPFVRARILDGKTVSDHQYSEILARRDQAKAEMKAAMAGLDALVTPTCPAPAIPVSEVDLMAPATPFARFVNYLDLAALSVPSGLSQANLPIGMQIVAPKHQEHLLFQIGAALETKRVPLRSPLPNQPW